MRNQSRMLDPPRPTYLALVIYAPEVVRLRGDFLAEERADAMAEIELEARCPDDDVGG